MINNISSLTRRGGWLLVLFAWGCIQPYSPPATQKNLNYLVVDGFINSGPDSTLILLSRTRSLVDTVANTVELNAQVSIIGQASEIYPLTELGNGTYYYIGLNLNSYEKYQLKILTSDGKQYLSDSVPMALNPPIDSINWVLKSDGVHFYANTHDPTNNTRFFKWNWIETWQYHTNYRSNLEYLNNQTLPRSVPDEVYTCWGSDISTSINIASTNQLSQGIISLRPLTVIPLNSEKMGIGYSLLVKQYALTAEAYGYWQSLQQTSEQLGSIFGPLPSQASGNMHCITSPSEPVLGYISGCNVIQQRIFVNTRTDLPLWNYLPSQFEACHTFIVPPDSLDYYLSQTYAYIPMDSAFSQCCGVYLGITTAPTFCANCLSEGGTNVKPSFWP